MFLHAKGGGDKKVSSIQSINGEPSYTKFNINKISTWFKNDGESDITIQGNAGLTYPKGSNKTAVFQSGFMWGAKIDSIIHVGGSKYRQSTLPGRVINGIPVNPSDPDVRIYRVRRDFLTGDLSDEVADGDGANQEDVKSLYEKDWNEWPAEQGAPYEDLNSNGSYEPEIDVPGVPGADQTIWFVCNDFDATQTKFMTGSLPLGIEEQVTVWGYNSNTPLGNMFFRKYVIINKNPEQKMFTDMYLSVFSDADIGIAFDDQVGCDTTLNLGFMYNGKDYDGVYNISPPAVGFRLLQGPIVNGSILDIAKFKGNYVISKKNMMMTSFFYYIPLEYYIENMIDIDPNSYEYGTLATYKLFEGKYESGYPFVNPITHEETKFMFCGDPITNTGWISNQMDHRMGLASGPFNMAYGDTQEVVFAQILAGAEDNIDRLEAVTLLKEYSIFAQDYYNKSFYTIRPPIPQSPINNETDVATDPILNWTIVNGSVSYSLQIATDVDFKNIVANEIGLIKTNYELSGLINSTTYYWRVSVQDDHGSSYYSQVYSFTTKPDLFKPTLKVSPISAEIDFKGGELNFEVSNTSIGIFNWEAVSNDTSWIKIISESNGTNSGTIELMVSENKKEDRNGTITISAEGAAGSLRTVQINQKIAEYEITLSTNPVSMGVIIGEGIYKYGKSVKVIAQNKDGYTFSKWTENDNFISSDSAYTFIITKNRNLVANYSDPHSYILQIAEMEGEIVKDPKVGLAADGTSLGPNGYILSNAAGQANLPIPGLDYDQFDLWDNDDLEIDFGEKSLAYKYSYAANPIYRSTATDEVQYLPFSVYRIKFPSMEKIRLFTGFQDDDGNGIWNTDPIEFSGNVRRDVNWNKPSYEYVFAWQGYDAEGNEINYNPANVTQYIADNDLYKSANIGWGFPTGKFKYPYLTYTVFVMYKMDSKLPDSNRQIRFFTAKPLPSDVKEEYEYQNQIPVEYSLSQNYPNPFNPSTNIKFALTKTSIASLKIYDILGREVETLVNKELSPGNYSFQFNGSRLSSGIYFYRLQTGEFTQTKKMLLIK